MLAAFLRNAMRSSQRCHLIYISSGSDFVKYVIEYRRHLLWHCRLFVTSDSAVMKHSSHSHGKEKAMPLYKNKGRVMDACYVTRTQHEKVSSFYPRKNV